MLIYIRHNFFLFFHMIMYIRVIFRYSLNSTSLSTLRKFNGEQGGHTLDETVDNVTK